MAMDVAFQDYDGVPKSPLVFGDRSVAVKHNGGRFAEAVKRGRVFAVASQAGVTSQAGLSATTPVLTLWNPPGSGIRIEVWKVSATFTVAFATAGAIWTAVGTSSVAAEVTGTLTTAHRNLRLGSSQGCMAKTFLAATLPAAPVAIDLLGVGLTGAITTIPHLQALEAWYDGALVLEENSNLTVQTGVASGASGMFCGYIWEEVPYRP